MSKVAVLFARSDSVYKTIPDLDIYDIDRDARSFSSSIPVIAHPPCRGWGRFRYRAKPRHDEKDLALLAVDLVRRNGGVLEHPESSSLWQAANLPRPESNRIVIDQFGGFTFPISQHWFGHRAQKKTWLYIVGVDPGSIPDFPLVLGEADFLVTASKHSKPWKKQISKAEREHTPLLFAHWLVDLSLSI